MLRAGLARGAFRRRTTVPVLGFAPEQPYDGWRGDPAELANRLIRSVPFGSEEGAAYYADTARQIVQLACGAPAGPPRDSSEFLARLQRSALAGLYSGHQGQHAVGRLDDREVDGAYRRYSAFFGVLRRSAFFGGAHGAFDGGWAFEDADAALSKCAPTRCIVFHVEQVEAQRTGRAARTGDLFPECST